MMVRANTLLIYDGRLEPTPYLVYDRLQCDLKVVHPRQFHGLIDAFRRQ